VGGDSRGIDDIAREMGEACRGIGFFCVTGHGFEMSRALFALPHAQKMAVMMTKSPNNLGYMPFEGETLDPDKLGDLKETFNLGLDLAADDPEIVAGKPFRGVNQ
jgi:isopenicillin N synthase-like dioxygenase